MLVLAIADAPPPILPRDVDAVLWLGDLEPGWVEPIRDLRVPKLGVHGNHDAPGLLEEFGVKDIQLRLEQLGGLTFTGFEGCPRYQADGLFQLTEDEARTRAQALPPADVLLTHAPPLGVNDEPDDPAHTGFAALRDWVELHRPRWLLHGHTHPRPVGATRRLGDTRVVHVRGSAVLDLEDG
jgi:Icc-related predicted phosphoesterase